MTDIPDLRTVRLRLRAPILADYPAFAAFMASDRARYMGGPHVGWAAWGSFCHDIAGWRLFGHGALMIDRLSDGACIGQVSINHGPLFPEKELGWMLYDGFEGHGYAAEAAAALRDWAFATLRLETLVSYIDPANAPSIRLAQRLGALRDAAATPQDDGDLVYRHAPAR